MSTLRQDATTRQWVILAPVRKDRPHGDRPPGEQAARPTPPPFDADCPFCPGNEDQTPPEVMRRPADDGWHVRIVPNRYGVLEGDGGAGRTGPPLFRQMPGIGAHEVVIESARHDRRLDAMSLEEVTEVVRAWRDRYRQLVALPHTRAVVVFKNFGELAGASLVHPHSQIVAVPVFLPRLLRRLDVATRYYDENGTNLYADLIDGELTEQIRVVERHGRIVTWCPFASQTKFETWIAPTFHESSFGDTTDEDLPDIAAGIVRVLTAIRTACNDPDYNLVLYSAPAEGNHDATFRWHLKVLPKLSTPAGFEMGSAMSINTVAPEDAALALRGALS
jgi:UDPglucose--hexose-1-phosphate uridylyltransferase